MRPQLLDEVSRTLKAVPHHGIGYGLLRYLHAPTAGLLGAAGTADMFLSYLGMIPEWQDSDAPVQFDSDSELPVRETLPGLGHPLELAGVPARRRAACGLVVRRPAGARSALSRRSPNSSRPR